MNKKIHVLNIVINRAVFFLVGAGVFVFSVLSLINNGNVELHLPYGMYYVLKFSHTDIMKITFYTTGVFAGLCVAIISLRSQYWMQTKSDVQGSAQNVESAP